MQRYKGVRSLLFIFLILNSTSVRAWWDLGHEVIATIALNELTPKTSQKVASILEFPLENPGSQKASFLTQDFVLASIWADLVKISPLYRESFTKDPYGESCHSLNLDLNAEDLSLIKEAQFLEKRIKEVVELNSNNIISCIWRAINVLRENENVTSTKSMESKSLALRYLIHLVGDIHQPLHNFSVKGNEGGNKTLLIPTPIRVKSQCEGHSRQPTSFSVQNVHFLVDAMLGMTDQLGLIQFKTVHDEIPKQFSGHIESALKISTNLKQGNSDVLAKIATEKGLRVEQWSVESIHLGMKQIYQKLGSPNHEGRYEFKVKESEDQSWLNDQLLTAGLRLGRLLNDIFDSK